MKVFAVDDAVFPCAPTAVTYHESVAEELKEDTEMTKFVLVVSPRFVP